MRLNYPGEEEVPGIAQKTTGRPRAAGRSPVALIADHTNKAAAGVQAHRTSTGARPMSRKGKEVGGAVEVESARCYYVSVKIIGADGSSRRGTVEVDGRLLRALADCEGDGRAARTWVRSLVEKLSRNHPQDLGLGSARWKTSTGLSLKDYVDKAIRRRTKRAGGEVQA
jgi:hypothetical protein